jgi:hypothetical protein
MIFGGIMMNFSHSKQYLFWVYNYYSGIITIIVGLYNIEL